MLHVPVWVHQTAPLWSAKPGTCSSLLHNKYIDVLMVFYWILAIISSSSSSSSSSFSSSLLLLFLLDDGIKTLSYIPFCCHLNVVTRTSLWFSKMWYLTFIQLPCCGRYSETHISDHFLLKHFIHRRFG